MIDKIKCPYCNHSYYAENIESDISDYPDEIQEECPNCNSIFYCAVEYSATFQSRKVPCKNGEPHKFEEGFNYAPQYYKKVSYCEYCNHCEVIEI